MDDLAFAADAAQSYDWTTDLGVASPLGIKTKRTIVREPFGVVGAITPWNFPHQINFAKLGPALAAGNTVVLKPAPDTPWCAAEVGRVIAEKTDIPPGVVNIVTSSDHRLGAQLSEDPRVDLVSFTGSTATGRAVMAAASQTIKKVFLELGGKSAFIVLDDADLASACAVAAFTVATHAGQGCAITTRLVVPRRALRRGGLRGGGHDGTHSRRRPDESGDDLRSADLDETTRPRRVLPRAGGGRRRVVRVRRRSARKPAYRVFRRTDGDQRLDQRFAGRARGDLRAGARGARARRRRRRPAHRERLAIWLVRHDIRQRSGAGQPGRVAVAHRDDQRQRRRLVLR